MTINHAAGDHGNKAAVERHTSMPHSEYVARIIDVVRQVIESHVTQSGTKDEADDEKKVLGSPSWTAT